jgi:hypothetical protein
MAQVFSILSHLSAVNLTQPNASTEKKIDNLILSNDAGKKLLSNYTRLVYKQHVMGTKKMDRFFGMKIQGAVYIKFRLSLTSALDKNEWPASRSGHLTL